MRILLFLCLVKSIFAAYIGNPASPAIMNMGIFSGYRSPYFKFTSGYLADYTLNKEFYATNKNVDLEPNNAFHQFGLHSQMATASLIIVERLELFGAAGGTKEHAKWDRNPDWNMTDAQTILTDFQSSYHFSWAAGCKVILLQWWQTYLSADVTYAAVPASHQSYFKYLNRLNLPLETEKQTFSMHEWQANLGLSSRFLIFTPYGGITYLASQLNIHSGVDVPPLYYENKHTFGYFFGLTLSLTGRLHLNAERRLRSENAYSIAAIAVF